MAYRKRTLTTAGDLLDGGTNGVWQRLGIGSTGQVLTVSGGAPAWGAAGAGSGGALTQISEVAVGAGGTASISFSSIPATHRTLLLLGSLGSEYGSTYDGLALQFNGDTGANYGWQLGYFSGSSAGANRSTGQTSMQPINITTNGIDSAFFTPVTILIPNYRGTANKKVVLVDGSYSDGGFQRLASAGYWTSAAAITSISLFTATASDFREASVLGLYGIA